MSLMTTGAAAWRRGGVGLWTPDALSPVLYLDSREAANSLVLKSSDSRVYSWTDQGSSGSVFATSSSTNNVGPKPRSVNGLRAVFFDASDNPEWLSGDATARGLLNGVKDYALLVVGRPLDTEDLGVFVFWTTLNSGPMQDRNRCLVSFATGGYLQFINRDTDAGSNLQVVTSDPIVPGPMIALAIVGRASDDYRLRVDGEAAGQNSFGFPASARSSSQYCRIGGFAPVTVPRLLTGDIFAIVLVDTPLSVSNLQRLEGWAAWAFQGDASDADFVALLPATHPYKSAPPMA